MEIALRVGADVPFFLFRHVAVARGIGENLEPYDDVPPLFVVLVCPRFEVPTAWVYGNFNLGLTNGGKKLKIHKFDEDISRIKDLLFNDLEQVTIRKFPEIKTIKEALLDVGAQAALMSGSGPSVFGLFKDSQQATKAMERIRHRGKWDTFLAELLLP
jgi:4-diphosphocytidyl-2-C-methyl-D-erythritol kinase